MITSLVLENWKSFESATLYIDPLTILIGANAAGKSNILDAFRFLQRIASGLSIQESIEGTTSIQPLRGGADWVIRKPSSNFCIKLTFDHQGTAYCFSISVKYKNSNFQVTEESLQTVNEKKVKRVYWVNHTDHNTNTVHYTTGKQGRKSLPCKTALPVFRQLEATADLRPDSASVVEFLSRTLNNLFILDPVPGEMRGYSPLSKTLRPDASNIAGVLAAMAEEKKERIEETIIAYVKSLPEKDLKRIYTVTVGEFKKDAMLMCEEGWEEAGAGKIDAGGMSDGTLRYLAIVAALLTRPENSLFIIEEADNGLHPSRAVNLLEMLKTLGIERKIDILITTHNPAILNAAGYKMIPFILTVHRNKKTGASLITPLDTLDTLPKLMASGSLGDISANKGIEDALGSALGSEVLL